MRVRGLGIIGLVAVSMLVCGLSFGCASALAFEAYAPAFSFGPGGVGAGSFSRVQSVAVDGSGDVYVYDAEAKGGSVYKFDSSGKPVNFLAHANPAEDTNVIENIGGRGHGETQVAVDSSGGPANGDIYVATPEHVAIYNPEGLTVGELTGATGGSWGESCGVAVDRKGDVYVGIYQGFVNRYTPTVSEKTVTNASYTGALSGPETAHTCQVALDSTEGVYAVEWLGAGEVDPVKRFESGQINMTGNPAVGVGVPGAYGGNTLAVDPSTNDVFIDSETQVSQLEWAGASFTPVRKFRLPGSEQSYGIATSPSSHDLYISNQSSHQIEAFKKVVVQPPTVGEAQSITRTTATLSGTVNPAGVETLYYYQYGTSTSYGGNAPSIQGVNAGFGFAAVAVPIGVSGLVPATTYHYRLVVTSADGTTYSPDETFTTAPPTPPTVSTGEASNVTLTTATVSGTIGPKGLETSYELDFGTSTEYGTSIYGEAGAGTEPINIEVPLRYLAPGTAYHYRFVAINSDGKVYGADQVFTTPAYSAPIVQPFTLPLIASPAIAFPTETKGSTTTTPRVLTKAQKLAAALKACHKKAKGKRAACEAAARKRYGPVKKAKKR